MAGYIPIYTSTPVNTNQARAAMLFRDVSMSIWMYPVGIKCECVIVFASITDYKTGCLCPKPDFQFWNSKLFRFWDSPNCVRFGIYYTKQQSCVQVICSCYWWVIQSTKSWNYIHIGCCIGCSSLVEKLYQKVVNCTLTLNSITLSYEYWIQNASHWLWDGPGKIGMAGSPKLVSA